RAAGRGDLQVLPQREAAGQRRGDAGDLRVHGGRRREQATRRRSGDPGERPEEGPRGGHAAKTGSDEGGPAVRRITPPPNPLPEAERGAEGEQPDLDAPPRDEETPLSVSPSPLRGGGRGEGLCRLVLTSPTHLSVPES